ncbi:nuclear transport factor 2 family protein [Nonomuraea sp. NPDC050536]|uniref:nuclear transport factor 2 family protein n=1 Tax=Nonomuraea sp. NPDC050536 TaxID=3364366 RepID=UPI0037C5A2A1
MDIEQFVNRYVAVWNEPDAGLRRQAVEELWAGDGVEYVETAEFRGHDALEARIAEAYKEFVGTGRFTVGFAGDVLAHHDAVTFTVQLRTPEGEAAWAARVVAILGDDDLIRSDHHFTVQDLAS